MKTTFRIGTYNVENLFDRFDDPYSHSDDPGKKFTTSPKPRSALYELGQRIRDSEADILGLQEIENFGALADFVQVSVGPEFRVRKGIVCPKSNDPRGIDLGLLSKFPLGRVISHRFNEFWTPDTNINKRRIRFSRDCLQVEIFDSERSFVLVTVFICHFKSKYSKFDPDKDDEKLKYEADQKKSADKRAGEAREVVRIINTQMDTEKDRFVVLGDFNDTPGSPPLIELTRENNKLGLISISRLIKQESTKKESTSRRPRDTHCWKRPDKRENKTISTWSQLDHILVSRALWELSTKRAKVMNKPKGKGSDHFLFWAEFSLPS